MSAQRLLHTFDNAEVNALEELFNDMKGLPSQNARIKALVQTEKHSSSCVEAWAPFDDNQFALLKRFYGGLASVFPGTATVDESDFSSINSWEKDDYRASLTNFSLEGILHSKQYFELLGIAHRMLPNSQECYLANARVARVMDDHRSISSLSQCILLFRVAFRA